MRSARADSVAIGAFVSVAAPTYVEYGIGKLSSIQGLHAVVTYFDIPDDPHPPEVVVSIAVVKVVDLPVQTRVFHLDEKTGNWRVGRVLDGEGAILLIQFPNGQIENLPRADLFTRWRKPITDPIAFLSQRVTETPLFAETRSAFVRGVIEQRAASLGMGSVLSSNIQLADYQFGVAKRVLQDPVQRYLLADEVGLGKTVEAGILIRQYILDNVRTARTLVVAPPTLVGQWRRELTDRFNLAEWLDDFIHVVASDRLDEIELHIQSAGMLVVDEAHHLSRLDNDGKNHLYELLRAKAQRVPRVLLLSATPVLSDTSGFLRVLHLLDPLAFPLDDLEGFERRLQSRQLIAEVVAALVPENLLSMEDDLDRLQRAFPGDDMLRRLIDALRPVVQELPDEEDEKFLSALSDLRSHLTETYKLHRRVLRNRRKSVPWATPRRNGLEVVEYDCATTGERRSALEALRVHLANIDAPGALHKPLFDAVVNPVGGTVLNDLLRQFAVKDARALELAQRSDELTDELRRNGNRRLALVNAVQLQLRVAGQQVVVFCHGIGDADDVAAALSLALPAVTVQRHSTSPQSSSDEGEGEEPWTLFQSNPAKCRVLVCDYRAEEGLNLHGGRKVAVHYDLPSSPNRIEQRIGRLDRFGVGHPVRSIAIVCSNSKDERTWLSCLYDGLQIFTTSIASLQYLVEETLRIAVDRWAGEGEPSLAAWRDQLGGPSGWVAMERRRIDQQDALDALGEPQDNTFEVLEAADSDWLSWREAFDGFALTALHFHKRPESWDDPLPPGEQVFRLGYSRDTGAPTLITLNAFIEGLLGTIDTDAPHGSSKSPLTFAYAYRRNTVLSKRGAARKIRPLRYGDALVESLFAFCASDDRGRVHAMWRHMPSYDSRDVSGIDLYFRFDFLVEADLPQSMEKDDTSRALERRLDGQFAPHFHTVWVSPEGQCVTEPPPALRAPYRSKVDNLQTGGRDYNLNAQRWQVLNAQLDNPWITNWSKHCNEAGSLAGEFLAELGEVKRRIQAGLKGLREQHGTRAAQLVSRAERLEGTAREAELVELRVEEELHQKLVTAVAAPRLRLDAAGAIFVAPTSPFGR